MGLLLITLGVALWWAGHLFKRLAPGPRAAMGDRGRGVVAIALAASIVLMVVGYRADVPAIWLYDPPVWGKHLNNLLVLVAFYIFGINMAKGALSQRVRHPMLMGFALWAFAHLLVRGDLGAVILFAGLALWALVAMIVINRAQPVWTPALPKGGVKRDLVAGLIVLITYLAVGWFHGLIGPNPFGG